MVSDPHALSWTEQFVLCESFNVQYLLFQHLFKGFGIYILVLFALFIVEQFRFVLQIRIVGRYCLGQLLIDCSQYTVLLVAHFGLLHHRRDRFKRNVKVLYILQSIENYAIQARSLLAFSCTRKFSFLKFNDEVSAHKYFEAVFVKYISLATSA